MAIADGQRVLNRDIAQQFDLIHPRHGPERARGHESWQ